MVSRRTVTRHSLAFLGAAGVAAAVLLAPPAHASDPGGNICADGSDALVASSVELGSWGQYIYTFGDASGSFQDVVPPPDFSPTTASNAELVAMGFPPRPSSEPDLTAWLSEVDGYSGAYQGPPAYCPVTDEEEVSPTSLTLETVTNGGTYNWGGEENVAGPYQKVTGGFYEPSISSTSSTQGMSIWLGLDHTPNTLAGHGVLIQAGSRVLNGSKVGHPFWEEFCTWADESSGSTSPNPFCGPAYYRTNTISGGQHVTVSVWYDPATNGSFYHVSVAGTLIINVAHQMPGEAITGTTATYITENQDYQTSVLPTIIGAIDFTALKTYAHFDSGSAVSFGSQSRKNIVMSADGAYHTMSCSNSEVLLYPHYVSTSEFQEIQCIQ